MTANSPITTHVLDTAAGCPATGVQVQLSRRDTSGTWMPLADGETDIDGRAANLLPEGAIVPGRYRLTFATGQYHQHRGIVAFHPEISVEFEVATAQEHYHVPLLLSPFGYTTYRGS